MRAVPVAAAVIAVLAACAPEPGPTTPILEPASPIISEPPVVAEPGPRTPLDCAGVMEGAGLVEIFGAEPELAEPAEFSARRIAEDQSGLLSCGWSLGNEASLSLVLVPLEVWGSAGAEASRCSVAEAFHQCAATLTLDSFVLESRLVDFRGGVPQAVLQSRVDHTLGAIRANVNAAGVRPAWQSPERAAVEYGNCAPLDSADITATLRPIEPASNGDSGDGFTGVYRAFEAAGYNSCTFSIPHPDHALPVTGTFSVEYVAGGGWAWPVDGDPIEVAGADEAVTRCFDAGYCTVDARVGNTWVSGGFGNDEYDLATAARYLAAIIPSLPIERA